MSLRSRLLVIITVIFTSLFAISSQAYALSGVTCDLSYPTNGPLAGTQAFCVHVPAGDSLSNYKWDVRCKENCGANWPSLILNWITNAGQGGRLDDAVIATEDNGGTFTCRAATGFSSEVQNTINDCKSQGLLNFAAVCGGTFVVSSTASVASGGVLLIPATVISGATCTTSAIRTALAAFNTDCAPSFAWRVTDNGGAEQCVKSFKWSLQIQDTMEINREKYTLCTQIPEGPMREKCLDCAGTDQVGEVKGLWTAVGCIPTTYKGITGSILKIGLMMGGGVAFLMILGAAFTLTTSEGEPKKKSEAQEQITAAIIGLVFIIFSITILQFIGVSILRIPGFGT